MRILPSRLFIPLLLSAAIPAAFASSQFEEKPTIVLVMGTPGADEYAETFQTWAVHWETAAEKSGAHLVTIGPGANDKATDLDLLRRALEAEPKESAAELWLVLIGHGTFDGKAAKFNLRGPDVSAALLAEWLKPFQRPLAVINTASSSGPFIAALSGPGRIVITATRSGHEQNYARFGGYFAEALTDPEADLDQDGQTSLLEAFLMASHKVQEFYSNAGRLATEHALLDDNGDGLGTQADWFRGVRAVKRAGEGAAVDGLRAHQIHLVRSPLEQQLSAAVRARRDELELSIERHRERKGTLGEEEYYRELEPLLLELARIYETIEGK
jgi:hypothetical protein